MCEQQLIVAGMLQIFLQEWGFQLRSWISQVRRAFSTAVICGYERTAGRCMLLNPPDDDILEKGDRLVALAQTGTAICGGTFMRLLLEL